MICQNAQCAACPGGQEPCGSSCAPVGSCVAGAGGSGATGAGAGIGGSAAAGGSTATGGTPGTGGGAATGVSGATGGGGAGGGGSPPMDSGAGDAGGAGGTDGGGTGGSAATGSSAGAGGGGNEPTGPCSSPEVRITEVSVGSTVIGYGREGDTDPIPLAIAAIPSGGSRLAWMSDNGQVHVAELDVDDQLVGTPFSFPANDFQDIAADDSGGVIALTRDAQGGGTLNCGNEGNLCIAPPSPIPCYDMWMVRFDNTGNEAWATKLTTASAQSPPYTSGAGANHFIWWYQHHTRIAYDGTNYAVYFCDAITIQNGSCVDIHEGDRMQVVGPNGALVNHPDSFPGGCSHSWNTRIVWDERTGHFVMVCATDNNNRIARPDPYRTILSTPDTGSASVGNLVLASGSGYWVSVSHQGTLRLLHFEEATPDEDITVANADFSHLASYGQGNMIVAWETGSGMTAEVRSASDGSSVSSRFSIDVPDHRYQGMKSFPDGSVAYPAQGTNNQSVRVARVLPCEE